MIPPHKLPHGTSLMSTSVWESVHATAAKLKKGSFSWFSQTERSMPAARHGGNRRSMSRAGSTVGSMGCGPDAVISKTRMDSVYPFSPPVIAMNFESGDHSTSNSVNNHSASRGGRDQLPREVSSSMPGMFRSFFSSRTNVQRTMLAPSGAGMEMVGHLRLRHGVIEVAERDQLPFAAKAGQALRRSRNSRMRGSTSLKYARS